MRPLRAAALPASAAQNKLSIDAIFGLCEAGKFYCEINYFICE
jgi:hypothetical protein